MFKLWDCTSYDDYLKNWPSIANKFDTLTNYQKKLGYKDAKDFFEKNAFAAQELANNRVGNILERLFSTSDLHVNTQEELKKFTYKAIDYLRMNDLIVYQNTRTSQTSYNNGRSDSLQAPTYSSMESLVGSSAWRSWTLANIEKLYLMYCNENDIPFLLDPEQFYNKKEINNFLAELDNSIQNEHNYTTIEVEKLQKQINNKQNIENQILLQQQTDEDGNVTGEIEKLGYFDEVLIQSFRPNNTIVDTTEGKKRAVINLNETIGEMINATVYQNTSETDKINAMGRIWAWGIENTIKKLEESLIEKIKLSINKIDEKKLNIIDQLVIKEIDVQEDKIYEVLGKLNPEQIVGVFFIKDSNEYYLKFNSMNIPSSSLLTSKNLFFSSVRPMTIETVWIFYQHIKGQFLVNEMSWQETNIANGERTNKYLPDVIKIKYWDKKESQLQKINFTVPHWEKMQQESKEIQRKKRELNEFVKKKDIQPIEQNLKQIKPVVETLKAKEDYRMKKLGLDPKDKYWEDNGNE
ncbi:hypothetical protein [Spiroplasma endosymbiont of Atherix ibis]|uniref:hypothetical protein n=1 Tax=Spiroplasma endosymbiont of Atherix ibis TaxID=3066291 RepID=UPI0030D0DB79